jgi:outer membrane protein, heavy metal efflux system
MRYLSMATPAMWAFAVALGSAGALADTPAEQSPATAAHLSFATALELAARNAPVLAAQDEKIASAEAAAIPAAALPDPKLSIGIENMPVSGADGGSIDADVMTMQKIGIMQDFPAAAKRAARRDVAEAAAGRARAERGVALQKLRAETAQAWLQRYFLEQQLVLLGALDRENELLVDAVQARLGSGQVAAAEALLPRQESLELADRRDLLRQRIDAAKASLRQWLGDAAYLPLTGAPPLLVRDVNALDQHIHKHPELAAYAPMVAQAEAELREAQASTQSDWGVGLDYQRRGLYPDMVSLQFTYTLPVSQATRQTPTIVARRHALAQLDGEREVLLREHLAQLEADSALYRTLDRQLQRLDSARLPLAQQRVDLAMAAYRGGQGDLPAVLAARRELLELRMRQLELRGEQAALGARLHFAYEEIQP